MLQTTQVEILRTQSPHWTDFNVGISPATFVGVVLFHPFHLIFLAGPDKLKNHVQNGFLSQHIYWNKVYRHTVGAK
jgi:hypothetical protein